MNHPHSISRRPISMSHAATLTAKSGPRRDRSDDCEVATLRSSILIVDDDPFVVRMLRDALEGWGYEVFSAHNGQEGLHVLSGHIVDGILLDVHMPVMDGSTMLDEIRWLGYQIPVVVMSGDVNGPDLRRLVLEGAQGFMVKPFSLLALRKLCAKTFENSGADSGAEISSGDLRISCDHRS